MIPQRRDRREPSARRALIHGRDMIAPTRMPAHEIASEDNDLGAQFRDAAERLEQVLVADERAHMQVAEMHERPTDQCWRQPPNWQRPSDDLEPGRLDLERVVRDSGSDTGAGAESVKELSPANHASLRSARSSWDSWAPPQSNATSLLSCRSNVIPTRMWVWRRK